MELDGGRQSILSYIKALYYLISTLVEKCYHYFMYQAHKSWNEFFKSVSEKDYSEYLNHFLNVEYASYTIYPPREKLFNAFKLTPLDKVKVVIRLRGRQNARPELGMRNMDKFVEMLQDIAQVDKPAAITGREISMSLSQIKKK